ncbi:hypothetical protein KP509_03G077300 [Ceratopteris richardii]|uniref:DUF7642 domain-containing protein n=1 Tax=Ceratopteris richardii TaxID=49495 RepID=A0A8T2V197_CERRI|nr:hypothetical protein KP509_03G077300 [Ceratopteris richardii]
MEAHLFPRHQLLQDDDEGDEEEGGAKILYRASFKERENALVRYETVQWVLLSLVLLLAWGAGLIMLLYLPFRRYAVRRDVQSRKLYVTTNAIVYKVEKPIFLPCMGVNRREKHILLSLVTDVAIEQGCLQSLYGVHSIKIENASRRKPPPGDDLQIIGVDNPRYLRKVVLMALANLRREQGSSRENNGLKFMDNDQANIEQIPHSPERLPSRNWSWHQGTGLSSWQMAYSANETPRESPFVVAGDIIIKKLDDISKLITRIGFLIEQPQVKPLDVEPSERV